MATHHIAKGLASLGRHGDTMLMHVSPSEVEGLKALGAMTGRRVTTNPHTGMPEAFDFGDFFTSLLPTVAGVLLAPETGGASLGLTGLTAQVAPIVGGMATGALVAGAKGDNPLMGGLMGGLGGYGGGNLGGSLAKMGANAASAATPAGVSGLNAGQIENALQVPLDEAKNIAQYGPLTEDMSSTLKNIKEFGPLTQSTAPVTGMENLQTGVKQLLADPVKNWDAYKQAGGSASQLGMPLVMAGFSGAQKDLFPQPDKLEEEKRKAEENKYRDPRTGLLNLTQASPDLKFAASGGLMNAYATGGTVGANQSTISAGGIQDLYGTNDQTTGTQQLSKDGYGIGRLENLASQGSNAKAADTFYAMGGPIAFAKGGHQGYLDGEGDGMSDSIPATIEGKQPARLADGEFVIPADVVSHIGNGSSKAGSKQLYAMLDRIRKARTGHTKQGKEINPNKYMPA